MGLNESEGLYLGKEYNLSKGTLNSKPYLFKMNDLTTHAICLGMTGSGKTGLGIGLLEELALKGIPAIIVDPKGDLADLMLTFPKLSAEEFLPWIDRDEAARKGKDPKEYAAEVAEEWKKGLLAWDEDGDRIKKFKDKANVTIYTPANQAGIPLSILNSFSAPSDEILMDSGALREKILSTTSGLLGLLGIDADPIQSREHILISTIFDKKWREKKDLDLPTLIQEIQKPTFKKVGVFDVETVYPQKERLSLSMKLNNLLASPGFQAWLEGEPLNIQNLLYGNNGKPRLAVISIAHLNDAERMFFVTLLLNELVAWMRMQEGTSNLRAVFFMDEIFGFFPPVAMPPSKIPMITLLKQARAFGLGIFLTTQNPVDLDYKGLSNCGTWFIGKLQTDRDRSRVIEGLNAASNGELDKEAIGKIMSATGKRTFLLRSIHLKEHLLFQTRWTLSYLRGPLTLSQIHKLMANKKVVMEATSKKEEYKKPALPLGLNELFVTPQKLSETTVFNPELLGDVKVHFVDKKSDVWKEYQFLGDLSDDNINQIWQKGKTLNAEVHEEPVGKGTFEEIPSFLFQSKNMALINKALQDYVYQNIRLTLYEAPDYKMTSQPGESKNDFLIRISEFILGDRNGELKSIQSKYQSKIRTLQDRLQRAKDKAEDQKSQASRSKMDTLISVGTTILGSILGGKISRESVSQAGTSIRKATRISKEEQEAARAEGSVESLKIELESLQVEMQKEIAQILGKIDKDDIRLKEKALSPRKSDIVIEQISLLWVPK